MSASFVELTPDQLNKLTLEELKAYYEKVSKIIDEQNSAINADMVIQSQYDYLILQSQSTINSITTEQIKNTTEIASYIGSSNAAVKYNSANNALMLAYNSSIIGESNNILNLSIQVSSLNVESDTITSTIEGSDSIYRSSALGYSSLYIDYMVKNDLYQQSLNDIVMMSSLLVSSVIAEEKSKTTLDSAMKAYTVASGNLSNLLVDGTNIHSTLVQYRIDEQVNTDAVTSTNNGLIVLNSFYKTAMLKKEYADSIIKQSEIAKGLDTATSNYTAAQQGTDQAIIETARIAFSTITELKNNIDSTVTSIQEMATKAITDTYDINVLAAQANIDMETANVSTYQGYYNSNTSNITYYSSLYEKANADINSSIIAYQTYDGFYKSSIDGSNATMERVKQDDSTFSLQIKELKVLSRTISSLYINYSSFTSTYNGLIQFSTLLNDMVQQSTTAVSAYSTFYDSTSAGLQLLYGESNIINKQLNSTQVTLDTYSTLIERNTANMIVYAANIDSNYLQQEYGSLKYRETFVRQLHINTQAKYDGLVLAQIQQNSTSTVTNLNTPSISIAYTTLQTVQNHLAKYSGIYNQYDIQLLNEKIQVSTAIGHSNTYTSLFSTQVSSKLNPNDKGLLEIYLSTQQVYELETKAILQNASNISLGYADIAHARSPVDSIYDTLFTPSQIAANASTISSFIIQGFDMAARLTGR
jgi:hypothetical protein